MSEHELNSDFFSCCYFFFCGTTELVVLTGAESELGQKTTKALLETGDYHIIGGVGKNDKILEASDDFTPFPCDLNSYDSVRDFCQQVHDFSLGKPLDRLVCYAGDESSNGQVQWSKDGHESVIQTNYLSPFLMTGLLLEKMEDSADARLTLVCPSNNAKVSGYLADLKGFESGFSNPVCMVDGSSDYNSQKATQDSKLCQKLLTNFLHEKYHKLNHVTFNDFMSSNAQDSKGLFDVIHDPKGASKSGISWTHNGTSLMECNDADNCYDLDTAYKLFHLSQQVTNANWPKVKVVNSPCPTLKVVGAITKGQVAKQELKRMREMGRPGISEPEVVKVTKRQKIAAKADKVVSFVLKHTLQRTAKVVSSKMLGEFPEEALTNYLDDEAIEELEREIFQQMSKDEAKKKFKGGKSTFVCWYSL